MTEQITPASPDVPAEAPAEAPRKDTIQDWLAKQRAKDAPKPDAPVDGADAVATTEEVKEPDAETKKEEPPKRLELQLAKAQAEIRRATAEQVRAKAAAEKTASELKELRDSFAKNPMVALEKVVGRPLAEIFQDARAGKFDVAEPALPAEVQAIVEREKQRVAEETAQKAAREREAEQEQAAPRVRALIDVDSEKYPYLASPGAEYAVIEAMYARIDKGESPDVAAILAETHEFAKERANFWLTQKDILRHAVKDPTVRAAIEDALGRDKQQPQSSGTSDTPAAKPPASVGTLSEVGSRGDARPDHRREIEEEWARVRNANR